MAAVLFLRIFLCTLFASALLLMWAYPDSIIVPNFLREQNPNDTIYHVRAYLWVIPFILMELVCMAGERKNLVWFSSLLTVLLTGLLLWPYFDVWRPELLWKQMPYEDARLATALGYFSILVFFSAIFRLIILNFLFAPPPEVHELNEVDVMRLDPSQGRSVKEIAARQGRVKARFLFGGADEGIISRFYDMMRSVLDIRRSRRIMIFSLLALGALWFFIYPAVMDNAGFRYQRDRERMYEKSGEHMSTAALYAAQRVLQDVAKNDRLRGMTIEEAERYLNIPKEDYNQLRDESEIDSWSSDDIHSSRRRFLTITDGQRRVVLYLRMNADKKHINFADLEEEGWNPVIDEQRRRQSNNWHTFGGQG